MIPLLPVRALVLVFAEDTGASSSILEGDLEVIFKAFLCHDTSLASFGQLIDETKFLSTSFVNIMFSHTRRQRNLVAHNLVRHAKHVNGFLVL